MERFQRRGTRPKVFERGEPLFWNDPYISAEMLKAHLDPNTDAASRRPETIDRTVTWLVDHLGLQAGSRVLDLGCGPGPYVCLENTFYYPVEQAFCDQYVVVDEGLSTTVYRTWELVCTQETIKPLLEAQGFRDIEVWGDLAGAAYGPSSPLLGVVCR